jgi:regulatory protein
MDKTEQEEGLNKAKTIVYRLLNIRLRSERELHEKLASQKLPNSIIEQALRYFKDLDLVDDRQFAQQWTTSRLKKPFGLNRIRIELKQKGIPTAIIQEALKEASQDYNELATAVKLAQHRVGKYKNIEPEKVRQRVYGYLQRRGFNTGTIVKAIETI